MTAGSDDAARIWSAASHKQLAVLTEPGAGESQVEEGGGGVTSATFSPDGKEILTADRDGTARIWNASTGNQLFVLLGHTDSVQTAAFSPTGRTVVTASADGTAKLWNAAPLEQLGVLTKPKNLRLYSAAFSPDGKEITGFTQPGMRIWSASNYKQLAVIRITAPERGWFIDDVSPDGKEILTQSQNGDTPQVWSASSHKRLGVLLAPSGSGVTQAAFSHNGKEIVGALGDGDIAGVALWSASSLKLQGVIRTRGPAQQSADFVDSGAFSPNDKEIMGIDENDGVVWVWSASGRNQLAEVTEPNGVTVQTAAFSPNGKKIVIVSDDGTARIWNVPRNRQLGAITEPDEGPLNDAEFSADGKEVVTASGDGTARIWNANSFDQLTVIAEPDGAGIDTAAFSPNGNEIVTTSVDSTARIWSTELAGPVHAIERIAEMRVTRRLTPSERNTYLAGI